MKFNIYSAMLSFEQKVFKIAFKTLMAFDMQK